MPQASGPIRILLVICRPRGGYDVPFRSVASRLVKGLSEEARAAFDLDVLRPPTFERLSEVLRRAKADRRPYHVVHFDGHGVYGDSRAVRGALNPLVFADHRPGKHGYLLFERPALDDNREPVDGPTLGQLLVETNVPVLVLNACRSAHAEASNAPDAIAEPSADDQPAPDPQSPIPDPHALVRAFGSLAQEVIDAGVAGVVAMRYNVYVVTAAQFVADLYAALVRGQLLGEAATLGRKQLAAQPLREIASDPIELQDWPVPIVYEAAPIALFPRPAGAPQLAITIGAADAAPAAGTLDRALPDRPDVGFFGRDETLLALDRAFDTQPLVLLHAYAGSGKTTTAAEFARWYALTGGVDGPVLFSSFEQPRPLARVLDAIGQVFGPLLEQNRIHWLALDDTQRRDLALQVLKQIPVLWIWDNVEPVAGFPAGTNATLTPDEQRELAAFLRAARETRAKFLLTSRRDERGWLGELPARIAVPPMPMQERVQLARALAEKHSRRLTGAELAAWRPLLRFTEGNPLTLTVLVGQALRDGLRTPAQIEGFVARLRAGEAAFADEASEGRAKSLGASLSYGFAHAFGEEERRQLALLHLFQGFVDVVALRIMGRPNSDWCLPEVRGVSREAGIALLDRAAEVGLLTAYGGGYYAIHPALPWYFRGLFERYYPHPPTSPPSALRLSPAAAGEGEPIPVAAEAGQPIPVAAGVGETPSPLPRTGEGSGVRATRAFVEAMGTLGNYYHDQYIDGNRDVIGALEAEEANLLHARRLARANGWWGRVIDTMQGLRVLYDHTGRRGEWQRLVEEIVPDFVDPATDGPLPGREEQWSLVTEYRALLAEEARQWAEAERLQRARVEWNRQRAAPALTMPPEALDGTQRNAIRSLAVSLHELGQIQRELGQPECVAAYEETASLLQRIGDKPTEAIAAFSLGHAYLDLSSLRNLEQAERWYRRSLELFDERDRQGRARCLVQLGTVERKHFYEAKAADKPREELIYHLNNAVQFYHQALDLLPSNAMDDLGVTHTLLGNTYDDAGDLDRALSHYREAIRHYEVATNEYEAARTRRNIAIALVQAGRLDEALLYAQAALRNYATYGEGAAEEMQETRELIETIEGLRNR